MHSKCRNGKATHPEGREGSVRIRFAKQRRVGVAKTVFQEELSKHGAAITQNTQSAWNATKHQQDTILNASKEMWRQLIQAQLVKLRRC